MLVKNLGGHSGCKIFLYEENGNYFVRKFSASVEYNSRLEQQCRKQEEFKSCSVKVPRVFNRGYDKDGLFYFDMEYIQGITLAKYISKINVSAIGGIAKIITDNIDLKNQGTVAESPAFADKIQDLKIKTTPLRRPVLDAAISFLEDYNWKNFSCSLCHGDLTLENIIVKNNDIYFIDFLDSFYDSWLLDIGKLLQDLECMWSYRKLDRIDTNTKLRLVIFKNILLKKLISVNPEYIRDSYAALLLHLVRIYPYAAEAATLQYLDEQVERILKMIREGEVK